MDRNKNNYHSGFDDGFKPRLPLDLSRANDVDDILKEMEHTAFGGRCAGEATDVLFKMITDKDAFVVMTLSGAMTPAGMGLMICDMIDQGFVQAVVSTGALMTHGFVESTGMTHFQYKDQVMSDPELCVKGYNRIYDVLELEKNLDDIEEIVHEVLGKFDTRTTLSSQLLTELLGKWLINNTEGRGILKSAYQKHVPVYIPAFTDSELGLDISLYNRIRVALDKRALDFNSFLDLEHYVELINQQKKLAIFTIGGGVPRNWAQQVAPYLELIINRTSGLNLPKSHINIKRFSYAVRICPEPVNWGGLSGCTYEEGKSWGKFESDCQSAEVPSDATIIWPFILKAVMQRIKKRGIEKINKNFNLKNQMQRAKSLTQKYKSGK